jgi:hypothetical protein
MFESLFRALNATDVRYVVVGGLATLLHGYARLTADVDLIIDLEPPQARRFVDALQSLGFAPQAPVDPAEFSDPAVRAKWKTEKGMRVFSMVDRVNPMRVVDLFVDHPLEFGGLWERSKVLDLNGCSVRIASIADLVFLKRLAGRPQDAIDIERLLAIERRQEGLREE